MASGLRQWPEALDVCAVLFEIQVRAGRRAVLEHPSQATSWSLPATRRLLQSNMAINLYIFDQCLLGLRTAVQGDPMRKRTKFMSNLPGLPAQGFNTRCTAETCNHIPRVHVWCQGKEGLHVPGSSSSVLRSHGSSSCCTHWPACCSHHACSQ